MLFSDDFSDILINVYNHDFNDILRDNQGIREQE